VLRSFNSDFTLGKRSLPHDQRALFGMIFRSANASLLARPMKSNLRVLLCLLVLFLSGATMTQVATFQSVGTVRQIMLGIVAPTSDVFFKVPNEAPKDDKTWASVQNSALTLAETGNLLMLPGRAKDKEEWLKQSKALVATGAAAFRAANNKDVKALADVGDKIDETCEAFHAKCLPKQTQ
jgi:hypothetical protein